VPVGSHDRILSLDSHSTKERGQTLSRPAPVTLGAARASAALGRHRLEARLEALREVVPRGETSAPEAAALTRAGTDGDHVAG
jgi:hypothetical protein